MTERDKEKIDATVLVVEDDILVRMPIAAYLRHCGYRVIEAASSGEALTVLGQLDLTIDVVLADVERCPSAWSTSASRSPDEVCSAIVVVSSV